MIASVARRVGRDYSRSTYSTLQLSFNVSLKIRKDRTIQWTVISFPSASRVASNYSSQSWVAKKLLIPGGVRTQTVSFCEGGGMCGAVVFEVRME